MNENILVNINLNNEYDYLNYQADAFIKLKSNTLKTTLYSFIKEIIIENKSDLCFKDLKLIFDTNTELIKINDINISLITPKSIVKFSENISINFNVQDLYFLSECIPLILNVKLVNLENDILNEVNLPYSLFPLNESNSISSNLSLLASFVTPNDPNITNLIYKATKELELLRSSNPNFIGYQANDIDSVRLEMCAVYNALVKENIAYLNPPSSFNKFQRVRLPNTVLSTKLGTCLDLSILYCSILEALGISPILVIIEGHAFAGAFLSEDRFIENVINDVGKIYNYSTLGNMKIELVETTSFTLGKNVSFNEANESARKHLENYVKNFTALNISNLHHSFVKPIPSYEVINENKVDVYFKNNLNHEFINKKTDGDGLIYERITKDNNKFIYWRKKLLDLSLKNKLINFSYGNNIAEVVIDSIQNLFSKISENNVIKVFPLNLKLSKNEFITENIKNDYLYLIEKNIYPISIDDKTYIKLIRKANSIMEETGSNALYLALGLLTFTLKNSVKSFNAPILLIPIKSKLRKSLDAFEIEVDIDNLLLNTTVFEFIKLNSGISFDDIYDINKKIITETNINSIFNFIRSRTSKSCSLLLDEKKAFISNFTFSNQILWNDLNLRKDELLKNDFIKRLVKETPYQNEEDEILDDTKLTDLAIPLGADSSQIKAIKDSINNVSFVLDGPPGTGKSQTIVNMIVNALYHHKSVLFVAQKMAALEVVKKRIDDIKLGDFCLEIHSNKATKRHVLEQIEQALNYGRLQSPIELKDVEEKLLNKKEYLNKLIEKLNSNLHGISLHDALTKYFSLKEFEFKNSDEYEDALKLSKENKESIEEIIETIKEIESARKEYKDEYFYPYKLEKKEINLNELKDNLQELKLIINEYKNSIYELSNLINDDITLNKNNIETLINILNTFKDHEVSFNNIYTTEFIENINNNYKVINLGIKLNSLLNDILKYYRLDILKEDVTLFKKELLDHSNGYFKRHKIFKNKLKTLKSLQISNKKLKISFKKYVNLLNKIEEAVNLISLMNGINNNLIKVFPVLKEDINYNYSSLKDTLDSSYCFINLFNKIFIKDDNYLIHFNKFKNFYNLLKQKDYTGLITSINDYHNQIINLENKLTYLYGYNPKLLRFDVSNTYLENYISLLNNQIENSKDIYNVNLINSLLDKLIENKFYEPLITLYRRGDISLFTLHQRYLLSYYKTIISTYFNDPYFIEFNGLLFNEAIKKYNEYLDEYNALLIKETASRVTKNYPLDNIEYAKSTNVYKLLKLIKNGGKNTSIRNILKDYEDIIRNITPIFFMSPLSAAQYLSIDNKKFDIVIFDEASQIKTCEALGAISRGNSLIIAGDPEQMPPSNFFKTNVDNYQDEFLNDDTCEDLESLLDDALTLNMKRNRLLWHYRSESESLIKFSNNYFYNHSLLTFPSPNNENKIFFKYLPLGVNDNGVNRVEAFEIVKEVKRRFSDENLSKLSIGIITFNIKQQELIEDLIEDLFAQYPSFYKKNEENKDKIFVKNLENVQGDERDVILFSIGYSKNKYNRLNNFFGPLSLEKGERRLNVAITRSRKEMIIYSSIKGNDIDVDKVKNNGAKVLKDFLKYAELGGNYLISEYDETVNYEEGVEKSIANDLIKLGYDLDLNIGDSKFKINIAIKGINNEYLLGIILDSKNYLNTLTCRDRNYVQPHILDRLNWKILRIYTLDYYKNKDEVIADILRAIKTPFDVSLNKTNPVNLNFEKEVITPYQNKIEYMKFVPNVKYKYESVIEDVTYNRLSILLSEYIDYEAPISKQVLYARFKELFDISRTGTRFERIFEKHLMPVLNNYQIKNECFDSFYYPLNFDENLYQIYRSSTSDQRDISFVSSVEIRNALKDILKYQNDLELNEVIKMLANLFNLKVINNNVSNKLEKLINFVVRKYNETFEIYENKIKLKKA